MRPWIPKALGLRRVQGSALAVGDARAGEGSLCRVGYSYLPQGTPWDM